MRSRRVLLPALIALLLVGCGAISLGDATPTGGGASSGGPTGTATTAPANTSGPQAIFPSVSIAMELARSDAERSKGLGGHAPLAELDGMLFVFDQPAIYSFWMKGMTFALDMMWIEAGKVVHLERNVPPPGPSSSDSTLRVYTPRAAARYVLEVRSGFANKYGIDLGTPVQLTGV